MMSRWGLQNKSKLVTSGLLRIGLYTIYYFTVGYDLFDFSHAMKFGASPRFSAGGYLHHPTLGNFVEPIRCLEGNRFVANFPAFWAGP